MSKNVKCPGNGGGLPKLENCDENSEGELSQLPYHTKVVVTGNNRTKSKLVGLQGVVKKAVGLGGWHWLKLDDGTEVKLQRNALTVIKTPTAHVKEDDIDNEDAKLKKADITSKPQRSRNQSHKSSGSHSKTMKKSPSCDSKAKDIVSAPRGSTKVDLSKLDTPSLRLYWQHYDLEESSSIINPTREQLLEVAQKHFATLGADNDLEIIWGFVEAINREHNASK